MKKIIKYLPVLLLSFLFSSCLKSGLEELPTFNETEITKFRFEFRWIDHTNEFGRLEVIQIGTDCTIDEESNTVSCKLTVPEVSGAFSQEIRDQVLLSNIVGYADISVAAIMKPAGDSPNLGEMADFSQSSMQYNVTAADGTTKIWNLEITEFNK